MKTPKPLDGDGASLESLDETSEGYQNSLLSQCQRSVIDGEHLNLLLPDYIDHDELRSVGFRERPPRVAWFGHLVCTRKGFNGYVPLRDATLRQQIDSRAIAAAKKFYEPNLKIDHSYASNEKSKGYKLRMQGCDLLPHRFHAPETVKRLLGYEKRVRDQYNQQERTVDETLKVTSLPIDIPSAVEAMSDSPKAKSEARRRSLARHNLSRIQSGDRGLVSQCATNGRIHCLPNRIPSDFRLDLMIDGVAVSEIDLASSQLFFLSCLFPNPQLIEAVQGEFYHRVNERLEQPRELSDRATYKAFKADLLSVMFPNSPTGFCYWKDPNWRLFPLLDALEDCFTGIVEFMEGFRIQQGPTGLAVTLQRMESGVFIQDSLMALEKKGIPLIPVHDAFLCIRKDAGRVKEQLERSMKSRTGRVGKLREERRENLMSLQTQ